MRYKDMPVTITARRGIPPTVILFTRFETYPKSK